SVPAKSIGLPPSQVVSTMYNLGQLLMVEKRYGDAVSCLESWRSVTESVDGANLALLAKAYFETGQFGKARPLLEEAIRITPEPNDEWRKMLDTMGNDREKSGRSEPE